MLCVMSGNVHKASLKNLFSAQTRNFNCEERNSSQGVVLVINNWFTSVFFVQNDPDLQFLALPKLLLQSRKVGNLQTSKLFQLRPSGIFYCAPVFLPEGQKHIFGTSVEILVNN